MSGFPSVEGFDSWIERSHESNCSNVLMISLPVSVANLYVHKGSFWMEIYAPKIGLIGWMKYTYQSVFKNQGVFAATEWRPASDPAPARQDTLLPSLTPRQEGSGHDQ